MKRDAGTIRGGPEVPVGDVRLGRVAALQQASTARRRSSDWRCHDRDEGADPAKDAAATERQAG
jgi:hypothetical protein